MDTDSPVTAASPPPTAQEKTVFPSSRASTLPGDTAMRASAWPLRIPTPPPAFFFFTPSGTEKRTESHSILVCGRSGQSKRQPTDISVQAVRMGNIAGIHEVFFGTDTETITLKHEAHDRGVFADGALAAAQFIVGKPAGLYNMEDLL